ncbi:amino acid ABC transporter substrate-binding protein [Streptomyces sp. NBC_00878]|uniref:amino acid ABC transporter substrate-binding protein n=1 Tax=Streptomyces sp. NBC_00878 TaxID=2975854 RepID=UPI00224DCBF0|nr:amino acid ABC transporter substrate-binding protein [Streptomyces sp. NBC_00878]MCX4911691.1 amino acid ABC transporter substrate-binding protein [Streptomyces sp. NBC_00878]
MPRSGRSGRQVAVLGATATLLLGAVACGTGSGSSGSGPITIGISLPLSGPVADASKPAYEGYKVWVDQLNKNGGLLGRQVELKVLDDGFDQNTVVSNYNRLISQERVDLLLGTFSSKLNLPASTVAERNKMLYVEPSGGADEIFDRGYDYLFFAQPGTSRDLPEQFLNWIRSLPADQRPKTAAYPTQDDPNTDVTVAEFRKELTALGVKSVYSEKYAPDTVNFDSIASVIARAEPDLVVHGAVAANDGAGLVKAFQKQQFSPKIMFQTNAPSLVGSYPQAVGAKNTEGIFTTTAWSPKSTYAGNTAFVKSYTKAYGSAPTDDAANAYTAGQVLEAAVKNVGGLDQGKLADWLHGHQVKTIVGPLGWDERGVPAGDMLLAQWQGGKLEFVSPKAQQTTTKVINPKPGWS